MLVQAVVDQAPLTRPRAVRKRPLTVLNAEEMGRVEKSLLAVLGAF